MFPFKHLLFIAAASLTLTVSALGADRPATLENNDSCDISVTPAATLLLPYFEVDLESAIGETTVFNITNVKGTEQIARVTLWTDLSYPVITFNIYLTGYDVQKINLYEVLAGGAIAPPLGTGRVVSPKGDLSRPNLYLDGSHCGVIPPRLDPAAVARMHDAFTIGSIAGVCDDVGNVHENAVGYATIDVVGNCDATGPTDPEYFTRDIRYDNVLIGDYQQVNSQQNFAQGNPMVHIRAIPDARQPLPRTFGARWINGGIGEFETSLKIWRQGVTTAAATCDDYDKNRAIVVGESIVFDEHGNGEGNAPQTCDSLCIGPPSALLPNTSRVAVDIGSDIFPQTIVSSTTSGWIYLNFHDLGSAGTDGQSWVVASMRAESRYSVDVDAAWLGNGCSPVVPITSYSNPALPYVGNASTATPPGAVMPGPGPDVNPDVNP
jgi:hypothetical protein